jgi:hypothetical protein
VHPGKLDQRAPAFSDPHRFLQICNLPQETFHERLRLLAAELGCDAEVNRLLAAGMSWQPILIRVLPTLP